MTSVYVVGNFMDDFGNAITPCLMDDDAYFARRCFFWGYDK